MSTTKIIVLDDDPTGSQTVHGCLLLTRWDVDTLRGALRDDSPLCFVLTNTRGMDAVRAEAVTRQVCVNLGQALDALAKDGHPLNPLLVSRSDSTLRGHYPVETDVIAEVLGPFDAHFMIPAFFEGGRFTREGTHYLIADGRPVPVHETEFARDSVFAYRHSHLPDYVEEKTRGRIRAAEVEHFTLDDVRGDVSERLLGLHGNMCCVVDAESQEDLDRFAAQLRAAATQGKRFLFRSAASLLTALAALPPQPVPAERMAAYVRGGRAGAVVVGSHVNKTTQQLNELLRMPRVAGLEVDVDRIVGERDALLDELLEHCGRLHAAGSAPVIFTSRVERTFPDQATRLAFGEQVSAFLMDIVRGLPATLGFLIGKGGITSNDVLSSGLALRASRVLGQILPGCSVVRCPHDHPRFPDLPVVIFPGNVGDAQALATAYRRLASINGGSPP
ncbi:four-carbon acid sugar kinase family protein [Acidihalobacter prosperus]|uniref:Hrp-dependent type III effector protein n=1 Tax=Acidihalobacter prosperus TaxID=160660 RepID=A0A1A6C8V8_9GAMM|nr:four-carbon acid sugar kinase family protein [Acidihalobacter prosperus]OBS10985.1 Hrp-dependent type III effector protein [Acidihalobacter prosperus]